MKIVKVLQELEKLLRSWGIGSEDWILVANYAYKLLGYDVKLRPGHLNILIAKGKIPWKVKEGIEIHPPRNTKYRNDFKRFIDETGYDFDINLTTAKAFKEKEGKYILYILPNGGKIRVQTPEGAVKEFKKLLSLSTYQGLGVERLDKDTSNIENLIGALKKKREKDTVKKFEKLLKEYKRAKRQRIKEKSVDEQVVYGIAVFGGVVKGRVRVIKKPEEAKSLRRGDILVAKMTSPTMVVNLPKISAIITEWGGKLSHAAILAREMGIPCIVGAQKVTKLLKSGDFVEVDAERGIVRKIKS